MSSRQKLQELFQARQIQLQPGSLLDSRPPELPAAFGFDRVEGLMLGLAVGDALGNTSEGLLPAARQRRYGEIRDYLPSRRAHSRPGEPARGFPSDDTQLAFWTLEQLLADHGFVPENVARRFCRGRIFGIGQAVSAALARLESGTEWHRAGQASAGNGALMRIAPMLIPHLRSPSAELWADTALCAMITHNDAASISACLAFVHLLWQLFRLRTPPEPMWWVQEYVAAARELEGDAVYRPRGGAFVGRYAGPLWRFVEQTLPDAFRRGLAVREACSLWYSGAFLLETVPSVLYILMRHARSFEEAVVRAVNDTKDNDSIAAIVGAAAGALHGRRGIPQRWVARLSGCTTDRDEGRVFRLLAEAGERWGRRPESA
jgi:ADP-ribosylglycohydrolase